VRALIQRVEEASVDVVTDGVRERVGTIGAGLCVLVGVTHGDAEQDAHRIADRIANLRIFDDADGVMNLSAEDVRAELLVISQFTLYGNTEKGRRPSWIAAARPEVAEPLIEHLVDVLRTRGFRVETGRFRTEMKVSLVNDGPVTVTVETTAMADT
jgi:D-tyrosyl-tRNA(Tyr) deacylase